MCCGDSKIPYDTQGLLRRLRSIEDLDIDLELNQFKSRFNKENGMWKNNFGSEIPIMTTKYDSEIKDLNQKLYEKQMECEELEKLYLAKTVRLLYMAQTHCQLKSENDKLFEHYGIKEGNKRLDLSNVLSQSNIENERNKKANEERKEQPLYA